MKHKKTIKPKNKSDMKHNTNDARSSERLLLIDENIRTLEAQISVVRTKQHEGEEDKS